MTMQNRHITLSLLVTVSLALVGCNKDFVDPPVEDYDQLFPPKDISKPTPSDEPVIRRGDPFAPLADIKYHGRDDVKPMRNYKVTVTAAYYENNVTTAHSTPSDYYIRYMDAGKNVVTWSSRSSTEGTSVVLKKGEEHTVTFTLHSGNEVMLLVNGTGERGTSVKGSITVEDETGLTILPSLYTLQHQNNEGVDYLPSPFCQYYILP